LVLGCTHYPLLAESIARAAGGKLTMVDSAANCASAVRQLLQERDLLAPRASEGQLHIYFTDSPDAFLGAVGRLLSLNVDNVAVRRVPPLGQ